MTLWLPSEALSRCTRSTQITHFVGNFAYPLAVIRNWPQEE